MQAGFPPLNLVQLCPIKVCSITFDIFFCNIPKRLKITKIQAFLDPQF